MTFSHGIQSPPVSICMKEPPTTRVPIPSGNSPPILSNLTLVGNTLRCFFSLPKKLSVHIEHETYLLGKSYFFADKWVVKLPFLIFCSELVCWNVSDSQMH